MKTKGNLVVVDIQFGFSNHFNLEYLNKVKEYVLNNEWNEIFVCVNLAMDTDADEYIPDWLLDLNPQITFKDISYESALDLDRKNGLINTEVKGEAWRNTRENWLYLTTPQGIFCPPKDLEAFAKKLSNQEVFVIGGGRDHCLADVVTTLEYYKVIPIVNEEYTYNLQWEENPDDNDKKRMRDYEWTEILKEN